MLRIEDLAAIGFVRKTHGFKGHLKIQIELEAAGEIETEQLFILIDEKPVPFFIEELSGTTDLWLVKLQDIDSETEARDLVNAKVCILNDLIADLPVTAQMIDIVGYSISDENLGILGVVSDYIERNIQDLIEMKIGSHTHLIPVDGNIIQRIDHPHKIIFVNLPEGLLNIND
jgi:16S rRNA processing protein RimM